jgi:putative transposase
LDCLAGRGIERGVITVDNGSEFFGRVLDGRGRRHGVKMDFIRPGKLVENAYIESFNGKLREECLSLRWFKSIEEAKEKKDAWRISYNRYRPRRSLNNPTPSEFAENFDLSRAVGTAGFLPWKVTKNEGTLKTKKELTARPGAGSCSPL